MISNWAERLLRLNGELRDAFSEGMLGDRLHRRALLTRTIGPIRRLRRLGEAELGRVLGGRGLVGVDGSVNTYGRSHPYYVDFFRAMAMPGQGEPLVLQDLYCPMVAEETALPPGAGELEIRQVRLAILEVQAALAAVDRFSPRLLLMDGPLVRFDMRAKALFQQLREKALAHNTLVIGCLENIESHVIATLLGEQAPPGWRGRYDRDILWDVLDYGEVLQVSGPAKGRESEEDASATIRTWFMQSATTPGVVGLDMLEEQVPEASELMNYLFSLSPADGRGIPIWLDLVDRAVRLTDVEIAAMVELLDPSVRRLFASKRDARFF